MPVIPTPQTTPLLLPSEMVELTKQTTNLKLLIQASAALQRYCRRRFDERVDTLTFVARQLSDDGDLYRADTLMVRDDDLKQITTLAKDVPAGSTLISQGTVIAASGYVIPRSRGNYGGSARPIHEISLVDDTFIGLGHPHDLQSIWIEGLWGWGGQWIDGTTLAADMVSGTVVSDVAANHPLEQGMVAKIGSEYLFVRNVSTNTITWGRAYNGSSAASHSSGAAVSYWQADEQVQALVRRLVMWAVEQIKSPVAGAVTLGDFSYPVDMSGLPKDVYRAIGDSGLRRGERIRSA